MARWRDGPGLNRNLAIVLLLMVFCGEAAIGLLMFHDLSRSNSEMRRMYERSVRCLQQIGDMQYEAQETRLRNKVLLQPRTRLLPKIPFQRKTPLASKTRLPGQMSRKLRRRRIPLLPHQIQAISPVSDRPFRI